MSWGKWALLVSLVAAPAVGFEPFAGIWRLAFQDGQRCPATLAVLRVLGRTGDVGLKLVHFDPHTRVPGSRAFPGRADFAAFRRADCRGFGFHWLCHRSWFPDDTSLMEESRLTLFGFTRSRDRQRLSLEFDGRLLYTFHQGHHLVQRCAFDREP